MGVSRLMAKGWVVFCLFAGGYALAGAGSAGASIPLTLVAVLLFGAMGLLFVGGFAASGRSGPMIDRLAPHHILPGFNEIVFMVFLLASFTVQVAYLPGHIEGGVLGALQSAIEFAVPGQGRIEFALGACGLDGGRLFAAAFAWLLAFIFIGSSVSRIRLAAGIVRLERKDRPDPLTPPGTALLLGVLAVIGIQLIYVGTLFPLLPCTIMQGIAGDMLIGLAPLMLAYLIIAALTNLLALGPEA